MKVQFAGKPLTKRYLEIGCTALFRKLPQGSFLSTQMNNKQKFHKSTVFSVCKNWLGIATEFIS